LTRILQVPVLGKKVVFGLKNASASIGLSVQDVVEREEFKVHKPQDSNLSFISKLFFFVSPVLTSVFWNLLFSWNLESLSKRTTAKIDAYVSEVKFRINSSSDTRKKVLQAQKEIQKLHFPVLEILPLSAAGMASFGMIKQLLPKNHEFINEIDALRKGLLGNVTTEMDLAIGDLADLARQSLVVKTWLEKGENLNLMGLEEVNGTRFNESFVEFLKQFGCRANSEIDISRPRWIDEPTPILNGIRGNLSNSVAGNHRAHHKMLMLEGEKASKRILTASPWYKRPLLKRLIRVGRNLGALREHHKFLMVQVLFQVRLAILEMAELLKEQGSIRLIDDVWFLTMNELTQVLDWENSLVLDLIDKRREEFEIQTKFKPPHVITSDGECLNIQPNSGYVPPGALGGLAVSSGVVQGRARVVTDPTKATLHSGEILVAPFTDPGWTPLFINASALVMEVGGYLTHGSVVSRENGIPAVSCIQGATTKIKTGMILRVDGSQGYVEILEDN